MPRKRKKDLSETPATEPTPVSEILPQSPIAQILASHEAKAKVEPDHPMPEPPAQADKAVAAFQRQREREQAVAEPSHVQQLGPRKRHPSEPASVFTSVRGGFKLLQDGPFRKFKFDQEPSREVKDKLEIAGFYYVPAEKAWSAAASWQTREASDKLAIDLDGKDISHGRGV